MGFSKPTVQMDWINDDAAAKYTVPGGAAQLAGHISGTNADPKVFNWCWWRFSQWIEFLDNTFDSNGNEVNAPKSTTITETIAPVASTVTLDAGGIKSWDGSSNTIFSVTEAGAVTLGYSGNDIISLSGGTLTVGTATAADLVKLHAITPSAADINPLLGAAGNGLVVADITKLAALTPSAADLNIQLGASGNGLTVADMTKLANIDASAAEIDILDGATLSTAELNILTGCTASAAEINRLDSTNGINITLANTSNHGVYVADTNAGKAGVYITDSADDGITILHADANGIAIIDAVTAGILIGQVGTGPATGIHIEDTDAVGIYMEDPGTIGLHIASPGTNAIKIDSAGANAIEITTTSAGDAISILDSFVHAIHISDAGNEGIRITDAYSHAIHIADCGSNGTGNALIVDYAPDHALYIVNTGDDAIQIVATAAGDGIHIDACSASAIRIDSHNGSAAAILIDDANANHAIDITDTSSGGDAIHVTNSNRYAAWFATDGTRGQIHFSPMAQPSTAVEGDVYWNTTDNELYAYSGAAWYKVADGPP